MYPIKLFKCFLIIVLCTFTALQSIPSSISSFIGRLKYWSLTDKSKHYNLAPERERKREKERARQRCRNALGTSFPSKPSLFYCVSLSTEFAYCLPRCLCKAPARWWLVDMTVSLGLIYLYLTLSLTLSISLHPPPPSSPIKSHTPPSTFCGAERRGGRGAFDDCHSLNGCHASLNKHDLSP